ncbi:hypothetical protein MmiHf6_10430 [Methanimicrococcus hongohii]|uniref:Uncharacterized protein n=1 Tax=Methanimicrococcus hongohii TaxID=3028295 RepID=A0AA96UZY3_9EURY|nr:hypothetical protein [Methanimicrococcus sp. Hf6]WNY23729.1 hypothetical protein MmiHf6_10430 [Methanimicrococcus sp. Hf6]
MKRNNLFAVLILVCLFGLLSCGMAAAAEVPYDLSSGDLKINVTNTNTMTINGGRTSYSISDTVISVNSSGITNNAIYIDGRNQTSANTIQIILNGVDIEAQYQSKTSLSYKQNPISIVNRAKVNLEIKEDTVNSLKAPDWYAAIRVSNGTQMTMNGTGTLNIQGGSYAAGIGGNAGLNNAAGESTGSITINDGIININVAEYSIGIGGGAGGIGSVGKYSG